MRVAIFGGTFDPIHQAHLTVASEAVAAFSLDEVLFIPAANPPHKAGAQGASYEDRYRMVELACAGAARFTPSRLEEGLGKSYSIATIERLLATRPADRFFFLIGADAFAEIETWKRWRDVLASVEFIVVSRPGHRYRVPDAARVLRLESLALNVSSSEIRDRIARGESPPALPPGVADYIRERGLYRNSIP